MRSADGSDELDDDNSDAQRDDAADDASDNSDAHDDDASDADADADAPPIKLTLKERVHYFVATRVSGAAVAKVAFVVSLCWLAALPSASVVTTEPKMRGTYFDETTLSPMASKSTLHASGTFDAEAAAAGRRLRGGATFCDELGVACETSANASHGVVRPSSGAAAAEALVVAAANDASAPLVLGLAKHLGEVPWLAKNVVAVAAADGAALRAWARRYVRGSEPMARGGALRAALVVDVAEGAPFGGVRVRTHGFDGELPNLDFAHLVATAFPGLARVDACLPGRPCEFAARDYVGRAGGLARWAGGLALGASGPHAGFLRLGVDAATIEAARASESAPKTMDLARVGVGVDLVLRSLNTVEHELHHGYFQYLQPDARSFASFDEVAGPLMLSILPLGILGALALTDLALDGILDAGADVLGDAALDAAGLLVAPVAGGFALLRALLVAGPAAALLALALTYAATCAVYAATRGRRPFAVAALRLYAAYCHAPLVLGHPCLLLFASPPLTALLAALAPLRDAHTPKLRRGVALALWLAASPPAVAAAVAAAAPAADADAWHPALRRLRADSLALGAPDRKLLYVALAYVPAHAAAAAVLFFGAPRRAQTKG